MPGLTALAPAPRAPSRPLPEPVAVQTSDAALTVDLSDGRTVATPLVWYPRLAFATPAERAEVELTAYGVHWPLVNEDVSVEGMLQGWPSAESPEGLADWRALMDRRRAQITRGDEPEPHYPTLPLPDWWDAEGDPPDASPSSRP